MGMIVIWLNCNP